jgi:hypothetical protein
MQRFKKYAIGAGAMLVLVAAIVLATGSGSAVAAQITSVFVTNDAAHPVPVSVGSATVPVHEQGTVTTAPQAATKTHFTHFCCTDATDTFAPIKASLITVTNLHGLDLDAIELLNGSTVVLTFLGTTSGVGPDVVLPLPQPLTLDTVKALCTSGDCGADINVVGS